MYSSHSGTPILSPLLEVVVVEGVVFELPPLLLVVVVLVVFDVELEESEPPQATSRRPKAAHSIRGMKVLFNN
jgi:hypothetical protein